MEHDSIFIAGDYFPAQILYAFRVDAIHLRIDFSFYPIARQRGLVTGHIHKVFGVSKFIDFLKNLIDLYYLPRYPQLTDFNEKTSRFDNNEICFPKWG